MKTSLFPYVCLLPPEYFPSDAADAPASREPGVGWQTPGYALAELPPLPPLPPSRPVSPSPPSPAERSLLAGQIAAEPRGAARDALACAKALELEARNDLSGLTQRVHDVAAWLLGGHVGRALRRLAREGADQRALVREAVPFVALGLLVGTTCVDGHVPGATYHGGAVLWRLQNTAHAVAMRLELATPAVRRMLKPPRVGTPLVAREPAAEVLRLALRYAVEESCGLGAEDNLARLLKSPERELRRSLHEALRQDCLLPTLHDAKPRCGA